MFGLVIGLAIVACVAVIGLVFVQVRRDDRPECTPQLPVTQQFAPPVIVFLGDGSRYGDAPYQAPAGLFAPPAPRQVDAMPAAAARPAPRRVVGEREECIFEEWVTP